MAVHFTTEFTECTACMSSLKVYKTKRRTVCSADACSFVAVEHMRYCDRGHKRIVFRSERLKSIVNRGCTYANDVMVLSAASRFTDGRVSGEIAVALDIGISERHVRRLSNTALDVLAAIHGKSGDRLMAVIGGGWVLQIDGTVDGDYDMIVVVRDAVSGFVLYVVKCHSESEASIEAVLSEIKSRYGTPVASMSDMRSGILAAMEKVFPGIPIGLCKFHFLRDIGKDVMDYRHALLGKALRRLGTKTALKHALQSMPPYDMKLLREVGEGYCSDSAALAGMVARSMLEELTDTGESSGRGFPFSVRHLEFITACVSALPSLRETNAAAGSEPVARAVEALELLASDTLVTRVTEELGGINTIFDKVRHAMYPEHRGTPLSDEPKRINAEMEGDCDIVMGELDVYMHTNIPRYMLEAAKHISGQYSKWKGNLFLKKLDGIAHTNNSLERVFRRARRNVRRRCGDMATGHQLTLNGEKLLLFQNMSNSRYTEAVFGGGDIAAVFGRERALLPKTETMTRKKQAELLEKGRQMLHAGNVPDTVYTDETWQAVQHS